MNASVRQFDAHPSPEHKSTQGLDGDWLAAAVAVGHAPSTGADAQAVDRLRNLLTACAFHFAALRTDVASAEVTWPRKELHPDEAGSFLRAVDCGFASVDHAGFVTLPKVRAKKPPGRYSLLSKNGHGVAVNLEYLIQIGTAAELMLDHGWPSESLDFERGAFDVLGYGSNGRVVLAVEAKARTTGPDGLQKLVREWMSFSAGDSTVFATNGGRKYQDLLRLCADGSVTVWLVAAGTRWTFNAVSHEDRVSLMPAPRGPRYAGSSKGAEVIGT